MSAWKMNVKMTMTKVVDFLVKRLMWSWCCCEFFTIGCLCWIYFRRYSEPEELLCQRVLTSESRDFSLELAAAHKVISAGVIKCGLTYSDLVFDKHSTFRNRKINRFEVHTKALLEATGIRLWSFERLTFEVIKIRLWIWLDTIMIITIIYDQNQNLLRSYHTLLTKWCQWLKWGERGECHSLEVFAFPENTLAFL